jgi:hypothetical protein
VKLAIQQGMNQQTPAIQHMIGSAVRSVRRGVKRTVKRAVKRIAGTSRKAARKLKFGSPAWQKKYKVGKFAKKK